MEVERLEIKFLYLVGKIGNGLVFMESNLVERLEL